MSEVIRKPSSLSKYPDTHFTEDIMFAEIEKHQDNIRTALRTHGALMKKKLVSTIKRSRGSGVHYPTLPNRSSAPGQKPVSQSGKLENSFGYKTRVNELRIYNSARSDKGAPYPAFLNDGTKKMAKRQYFDNTIESGAMFLTRDLKDFNSI